MLDLLVQQIFFSSSNDNRPFQDNCGLTFIQDICEWKSDDFAEKS
jgi:hypothetical protein